MLNVIAIQPDTHWQDKASNHADIRVAVEGAAVPAGSLVVLPEMFDVGFTMDAAVATDEGVDTSAFLSGLARTHDCAILAGFARREADGGAVNQASLFGRSGDLIASYVKCQGFTPGGEHVAYRGGTGPCVVEWGKARVAPFICYDLRFPELFRAATKLGAEVLVVIANWPDVRIEHWLTLARARAIENLAYVVAVNRCGRDPNMVYPGQSLVVDPKGNVVARAGGGPEVMRAALDLDALRAWRRDFPPLRDARFW